MRDRVRKIHNFCGQPHMGATLDTSFSSQCNKAQSTDVNVQIGTTVVAFISCIT